jgi:hypothetical protein
MPDPFSQRTSDLLQDHEARIWRLGSAAVILAVIPPGTTRKTGSDQMDGPADLTSKDVTRCYPVVGWEATHNRSVAGSRPASPTHSRPSASSRSVRSTPPPWTPSTPTCGPAAARTAGPSGPAPCTRSTPSSRAPSSRRWRGAGSATTRPRRQPRRRPRRPTSSRRSPRMPAGCCRPPWPRARSWGCSCAWRALPPA